MSTVPSNYDSLSSNSQNVVPLRRSRLRAQRPSVRGGPNQMKRPRPYRTPHSTSCPCDFKNVSFTFHSIAQEPFYAYTYKIQDTHEHSSYVQEFIRQVIARMCTIRRGGPNQDQGPRRYMTPKSAKSSTSRVPSLPASAGRSQRRDPGSKEVGRCGV